VAENEYQETAWGWTDPQGKCTPMFINRPKVNDYDVKIDLEYCGVCHSDVSIATNYVGGCTYPIVPGHEMVGTVVEVGKKVSKLKIGDKAGIGVMSDSCLQCPSCDDGHE
jgi:D-arabinose 1-dehydrogenase-like Zn-dependent alcohol dehydrogenase